MRESLSVHALRGDCATRCVADNADAVSNPFPFSGNHGWVYPLGGWASCEANENNMTNTLHGMRPWTGTGRDTGSVCSSSAKMNGSRAAPGEN